VRSRTRSTFLWMKKPVASLRWVTPGAATEGVSPLFFLKNLATFFAHCCRYHYRFLLLFTRVSTPPGCHPTSFLPVRPRFSTIICKFAHKTIFSFGCHPLEGVTRGGPPSDATGTNNDNVFQNDGRRTVETTYGWLISAARTADSIVPSRETS